MKTTPAPKRRLIELPGSVIPSEPAIEAIAQTIAQLLHPHAEVVLHDLATGTIARIWNPFSARKAGEPSDLDDIDPELTEGNVVGPYEKASPKGTRLKSISTILRDRLKIARFMLCINLDVSQFDMAAKLLQGFGATSESRQDWMFRKDIREQINLQIADYLKRHNLSIQSLDQSGRVALVAHLDASGAFQTRRAVDHIAAALALSRTTVYLLLRQARESKTPKAAAKTRKRK
ncbi:helix-turn-helix transcriptional regulator [Dongia sedimenti]|uniref:PAS domain-containing protein n=1 Tax=Dongia sedimenti TaxID=3064282 RepID=A0ABU0YMI1_9PROT|nr:PAS domain-containing protein [Rhodospirillaceae bacterium R-7]